MQNKDHDEQKQQDVAILNSNGQNDRGFAPQPVSYEVSQII